MCSGELDLLRLASTLTHGLDLLEARLRSPLRQLALLAFVARLASDLQPLALDREQVVGDAAGDRYHTGGVLAEHRVDLESAS